MRTLTSRSSPLLAVLLFFTGSVVLADHHTGWGPNPGTKLPAGLTVATQDGKSVDILELATDKGLVIAFVRSADWCSFCKRQIIELNKSRDDFDKRGVSLVTLSYDSVEILREFSSAHNIGYTLVSDPESKVIDALGIRNEDHEEGSTGYGIPHPGIMIFDASGLLIAKLAEDGYRKRPPVESVLKAIDRHW